MLSQGPGPMMPLHTESAAHRGQHQGMDMAMEEPMMGNQGC